MKQRLDTYTDVSWKVQFMVQFIGKGEKNKLKPLTPLLARGVKKSTHLSKIG